MPFELKPTESVADGVRRIVDEQLANALDEVRDVEPARADPAIHAARKRFKRLRAIIRLVREELGDNLFAAENACFRDAGASLGEARDAAVLVETLASLRDDLDPDVYAVERRRLLARRRAVKARALDAGDGLTGVAHAAEAARERVAGWAIAGDGWDALAPGLKRVYRDGRQAFERAEVGGAAERFHDLRKRAKDLWHQTEILEGVWPPMMKPLASEFHELADLLGDDHDLAVLQEVVQAEALANARGPASPVVDVAQGRRVALQQRARLLGAKLFTERPKAFVRRIGEYWRAWRAAEAGEPNVEDPALEMTVEPTEESKSPPTAPTLP